MTITARIPLARLFRSGSIEFPGRLDLLAYRLWVPGRADVGCLLGLN